MTIAPNAEAQSKCNVCNLQFDADILVKVMQDDTCPQCQAKERQRAIQWAMDQGLDQRLNIRSKEILACHLIRSERIIFRDAKRVVNFDVRPLPGLDIVMDIQEMHPIVDEKFDAVIAIAIFQHVKDDRKALKEVRRILRPGGVLFAHVGLTEGQTIKWEDESQHYGRENLKLYGVGTYRKYGYDDFNALLGEFFSPEVIPAIDPVTGRKDYVFLGWKR